MSRFITKVEAFVELLVDVQESDRDAVVVITGDTGEGKSVFLWQVLRVLCRVRGLVFDPVSLLVFDRDEFNRAVDEFPETSGVGIDEAVGVFYSRDYHDEQQIALLKKLDRIRYRRLVLAMAIPSLFHIDKHIRDSRVRYWVYIKERKGKGGSGFAHALVFEKEKNPFNSDPWNMSFNRELFSKGRIDKSRNYVGEIIFKDVASWEYGIYKKVKNLKRELAEGEEWLSAKDRKRRRGH